MCSGIGLHQIRPRCHCHGLSPGTDGQRDLGFDRQRGTHVDILFTALESKGLLSSTAVFVTGEFGRTPKINQRGGRDPYPRSMFCLLGGGGIKGGQVVGESDAKAENPRFNAITPDDVAATFYKAMGINPTKEYRTPGGRPVMIVRYGTPVNELLA